MQSRATPTLAPEPAAGAGAEDRHRRATARRAPSGPMRSRELTARGVRLNIGRSLTRHHRLGRPWRAPLGQYHPALPGCWALAAAVTPRRRVWHTERRTSPYDGPYPRPRRVLREQTVTAFPRRPGLAPIDRPGALDPRGNQDQADAPGQDARAVLPDRRRRRPH